MTCGLSKITIEVVKIYDIHMIISNKSCRNSSHHIHKTIEYYWIQIDLRFASWVFKAIFGINLVFFQKITGQLSAVSGIWERWWYIISECKMAITNLFYLTYSLPSYKYSELRHNIPHSSVLFWIYWEEEKLNIEEHYKDNFLLFLMISHNTLPMLVEISKP